MVIKFSVTSNETYRTRETADEVNRWGSSTKWEGLMGFNEKDKQSL